MRNFVKVKTDGMTTVFFQLTLAELNDLGYDNMSDMSKDVQDTVEANYPGLLNFAEFDTHSRFMAINCDTEEIAETVNEELHYFMEYREAMVNDAMNFEGGLDMDQINEAIEEVEKTLAKLKNLLV